MCPYYRILFLHRIHEFFLLLILDPLTRMIQEITERTEIAILDLVQEIVEAPEADPDPEVP